jgi:acyl carrier protein
MEEKFMTIFLEALELEHPLQFDTKLITIEAWDSLAQLTIASLLDEEMNVNLTAKDFESSTTIMDLYNIVRSKI